MIDFHCHLDLYPDPHTAAEDCQVRGLGVLSVTTTPSAWPGTSKLAVGRSVVRTALGLHPQLAAQRKHELGLFDAYLPDTRFVGEVGLDGSPAHRSSWGDQIAVFEHVLRRCEEAGDKVLSVHSRGAAAAVLDSLDGHPAIGKVVLHWFSGTIVELRRAVSLGCWFSVGPSMLASERGRNLIQAMPRDKVLLETDGPFTRQGGKPLWPWHIERARDLLASLWDTGADEAELMIRANEMTLLSS